MTPPAYPALHASHAGVWIATPDGEVRPVGRGEAIARAAETPMILLNAPLVGQRLGYPELSGLDLLELFAFVHPARFAVPTPKGLARTIGLAPPADDAGAAAFMLRAAEALLSRPDDPHWAEREGAWTAAQTLARMRWPWASLLTARLKMPERAERWLFTKLPEWEERPARAVPRTVSLGEAQVLERLDALTGRDAEPRPGQRAYAGAARGAFDPRSARDTPNLVLAEAGTGIGKTLGYLAPASLWAAHANGAVWISTFTKALQRQLAAESRKLFPDERERRTKVVLRKGREIIYACSISKTRCRAASRGARRFSRSSSRAGRRFRPMATWSAATCPAGCRRCFAATARPR